MSNPAIQQLLALLRLSLIENRGDPAAQQLLVIDENFLPEDINAIKSLPDSTALTLVSNRFDLAQYAREIGLSCHFNDFDFSFLQEQQNWAGLSDIFVRTAKEKAVNHHLINSAARLLKPGGQFHIAGSKQEGTKTYIKKAAALFGDKVSPNKQGASYSASISQIEQPLTFLEDEQYPLIRTFNSGKVDVEQYFSKPGLFGWNKIDQGSAMLAGALPDFFARLPKPPAHILDLGCGYGYLSAKAAQTETSLRITATDNNAAAIASCQRNFAEQGIHGDVVADDCAAGIAEQFDAVISHPPFHKGFKTDAELGRRFITSAYFHLEPGGRALMVANSFIPLEKLAKEVFGNATTLLDNQQFKLVEMAK